MSEPPQDESGPGESAEWLGALLHERHHWLQCVGTSMGFTLGMLTELRATTTISFVNISEIRAHDLPLLQYARDLPAGTRIQRGDKIGAVALWERLECLRRVLNGARVGDIECLLRDGIFPSHRTASNLAIGFFGPALGNDEGVEEIKAAWARIAELDVPGTSSDRTLLNYRMNGWSVGARHFMECAARINEYMLLAVRLGPRVPLDLGPMFTGVYGVANEIFYRQLGEPSIAKEVALAFACDLAINGPNPPVFPFLAYQRMRPIDIFMTVVDALKKFPFNDDPDVREPESVRGHIESLRAHVSQFSPGLGEIIDLGAAAEKYIGHLDPESASMSIFEADEHGIPRSGDARNRITYHMAICAEALRIRRDNPEFFILPATHYLKSREDFHRLFDVLQPPLVSYGKSGLQPTRNVKGWLTYFTMGAIFQELNLALVVDNTREILPGLLRYAEAFLDEESGVNIVCYSIQAFFEGSELGELLCDQFRSYAASSR